MAFEGPCTATTYIDSLNPAWPTGTDFRSKGDDHFRYLKCLILNTWPLIAGAINVTDVELNYLSGVTSNIQDQLTALETRIEAIETSISDVLTQNLYAPVGTRMIVHQAAAPTGWVNAADSNDRSIRIVSSGAGGTSGTWTVSGLTAANHALTIAQLPSHSHGGGNHRHTYSRATSTVNAKPGGADVAFSAFLNYQTLSTDYSGTLIQSQGSGSPHNHSISSNGAWRPASINCLVIRKRA